MKLGGIFVLGIHLYRIIYVIYICTFVHILGHVYIFYWNVYAFVLEHFTICYTFVFLLWARVILYSSSCSHCLSICIVPKRKNVFLVNISHSSRRSWLNEHQSPCCLSRLKIVTLPGQCSVLLASEAFLDDQCRCHILLGGELEVP